MLPPEECERREWLLSLRTGGYSSSTICGINSRTYHGYLVVPLNQPHKRYVLLSKFEDFLITNEGEFPLSTNHYEGAYYPDGYRYLKDFKWGRNYVRWVYEVNNVRLEKTLIAHEFENAITVEYKATDGRVKICPLITYRSHHLVTPKSIFFDVYFQGQKARAVKDGIPFLNFLFESGINAEMTGYWYYNFFYILDYERGSNHKEDLFNPFCVTSKDNTLIVHVYYDKSGYEKLKENPYDVLKLLASASTDFLVKGKEGWAIIAGYHWFDEWGRDTFISMEGILLLNGLYKLAQDITARYLSYSERGMLPNHITPEGEPIYMGVDVSLWAINAVYKIYTYSGDKEFIRRIYPQLQEIVEWYSKGNGIVYIKDNLLFHKGAPRTWMDASYNGRIVTPREGAAVEINALWYNALMVMNFFSKLLGDKQDSYVEMAEKVRNAFNEKFVASWGLYDYIDQYMISDKSIRPNQLFALSLPFNVLPPEMGKVMLATIENELLRPYGLSTLSMRDPRYKPIYRGDRASRDEAYHNGPIWPWLIGAYIDAKLKVESDLIKAKMLIDIFRPLLDVIKENNGYIPELFEDIPPYLAGGCIAQAWSVAEVYRGFSKVIGI